MSSAILEEDKPRFVKQMQSVQVTEGETARLDCVVVGKPEPEVTWFKEETAVKESERVHLTFSGDHCQMIIDQTGEVSFIKSNSFCRFQYLWTLEFTLSALEMFTEKSPTFVSWEWCRRSSHRRRPLRSQELRFKEHHQSSLHWQIPLGKRGRLRRFKCSPRENRNHECTGSSMIHRFRLPAMCRFPSVKTDGLVWRSKKFPLSTLECIRRLRRMRLEKLWRELLFTYSHPWSV